MRSYCKSTGKCLRKQLLHFLDAPPPVPYSILHSCCDVCKSCCACSSCRGVSGVFEISPTFAATTIKETATGHYPLSERTLENLEEYITALKNERKCLQLRSRFHFISKDILQGIVSQRKDISSVSYLTDNFPIFSKPIAEEITKIISQRTMIKL